MKDEKNPTVNKENMNYFPTNFLFFDFLPMGPRSSNLAFLESAFHEHFKNVLVFKIGPIETTGGAIQKYSFSSINVL